MKYTLYTMAEGYERKCINSDCLESIYENLGECLDDSGCWDVILSDDSGNEEVFKKNGIVLLGRMDTSNNQLLRKFIFEYTLQHGKIELDDRLFELEKKLKEIDGNFELAKNDNDQIGFCTELYNFMWLNYEDELPMCEIFPSDDTTDIFTLYGYEETHDYMEIVKAIGELYPNTFIRSNL